MKLGVDANGGWADADDRDRDRSSACASCDIYFAEQPVPAGDTDAMAEVRAAVDVPIIADESVYTLADAKMLARDRAADVFSIYVGKAGGIGPASAIAEFAQSAASPAPIGSNLELGVGRAAMIHLAWRHARHRRRDLSLRHHRPAVLRGRHRPPSRCRSCRRGAVTDERPGLGVELDDEKVEKYRVTDETTHAYAITLRRARSAASAGLPTAPCGRLAEIDPVVLPVAGDAGEQASVGRHAFRPAQDDAAVVDDADLGDRLLRVGDVAAAVVEVQDLAGQRELAQVLRRELASGSSSSANTSAPLYMP